MSSYTEVRQSNGLKIVTIGEVSDNGTYDDMDKFIESLPIESSTTRKTSLDELSVTPSGTFAISGLKSDFKLSKIAYNALMNYLSIPVKFISRTPSELTITIINRFLTDSLVTCELGLTDGVVTAIGKTQSLSNIPPRKFVFEKLIEDNPDLHFCWAINEGNTTVCVFTLKDIEEYGDKPMSAIEIMYCDDAEKFPTVSGMMLTADGHARFGDLVRSSNPNEIGNLDVVESLKSHIYEIKQALDDTVTKNYANMSKHMTPSEWKDIVFLGKSVFGKFFNLKSVGEVRTPKKIFKKVSAIKESGKFTLEQKREHTLYLGKTFLSEFN